MNPSGSIRYTPSEFRILRKGTLRSSIRKLARQFVAIDGFTLVEALIVLFLVGILGLISYSLLVGASRTSLIIEANNDINAMGLEAVGQIERELSFARRLLQKDDLGTDILYHLERLDAPIPIESTQLPQTQDSPSFSPADDEFVPSMVGNSLLFIAAIEPFSYRPSTWDEDEEPLRVDLLWLVHFYLTKEEDGRVGRDPGILRMVRWRSDIYADYLHVEAAGSRNRAGLIKALKELDDPTINGGRGVTHLLLLSASRYEDLFLALGKTWPPEPDPNLTIYESEWRYLMLELGGGRITGDLAYSVAFNSNPLSFDIRDPVPLFATPVEGGDGFPNGFEVLVGGPAAARRIFCRLVLAARPGPLKTRLLSRENTVLTQIRDY